MLEKVIKKLTGTWKLQNWEQIEHRLWDKILEFKNGKRLTGKEIDELIKKNQSFVWDRQEHDLMDKTMIYYLRKSLQQFNQKLPMG